MKLYEFFQSSKIGLINPILNPFDSAKRLRSNKPCHFFCVCNSYETVACMTNRDDNRIIYVCQPCIQMYFTSNFQCDRDTIEYLKSVDNLDLDREIQE
jgi:transcription elongation factor Elf1